MILLPDLRSADTDIALMRIVTVLFIFVLVVAIVAAVENRFPPPPAALARCI